MRRLYALIERNPATASLLALGIGALAVLGATGTFLRGEDTRRIVVGSPCAVDAASRECQSIRRDAERAESNRTNCISFEQADYPCPKDKGGSSEPSKSQARAVSGGGRPSSGAVGDGDDGSGDGSGPVRPAPEPGPGAEVEPPPAPQPPPTQPPAPSPPTQPPQPSVGRGVDQVLDGVDETVDGVKGTACQLAGVCLGG